MSLPEAGASQGAGLVRNAFHEAAVAGEHIGVVIHKFMLGRVVTGGQHALGQLMPTAEEIP